MTQTLPSTNQGTENVGQASSDAARFKWRTLSQIYRLVTFAPVPLFPDLLILLCIVPVIIAYMVSGYYLLLAPGNLYNSLVSENWHQSFSVITRFCFIASGVLTLRVIRNVLKESASNQLRQRLTHKVHSYYFTSSTSSRTMEAANFENTAHTKPPYYKVVKGKMVDNPDQRIAGDAREFSSTLFTVLVGDSGGVLEAVASILFYSYATFARTGWFGVLAGWIWSAGAGFLSLAAVNHASPVLFAQERLEATLRYAHARFRRHTEEIAFLRGGSWEQTAMNEHLTRAVQNQWVVISRHAWLNALQNGFSYYVSVIMYVSLAVAIQARVFQRDSGAHSDSFPVNGTPGEKAQWISQAGSVFMQLLFAFTMLVNLSTDVSTLVANTERLHALAEALAPHPPSHLAISSRGRHDRQHRSSSSEDQIDDTQPLIGTTGNENDDSSLSIFLGDGRTHDETESNPESNDSLSSNPTKAITTIILHNVCVRLNDVNSNRDDETYVRIIGPINMNLTPGKVIHLRGPTGSGKTSVLRMIRGLRPVASGFCEIVGEGIRYVPQGAYVPVDAHTLRELVIYPGTVDMSGEERQNVLRALRLVGWHDSVVDIDQQRDWHSTLSPGQVQLVAAARILCARTKIAVLDEATSALDEKTERRVITALRNAGIGLLFVGHSRAMNTLENIQVIDIDS